MKITQTDFAEAPAATVGDLPTFACSVLVSVHCKQVYAMFVSDTLMPGLVVQTASGELCALLSRQRFMEVFSQTYRREVYFSRPLESLLRDKSFEPLCVPAEATVALAAELALNRSRERFNEPIAIDYGLGTYKVLETRDLLLALANTHAYQHSQLQVALDSLIQAEKLASLGALVAGVAHEINTPVGVSLSAASHLNERVLGFGKLLEGQQIRKADLNDFVAESREASAIILHNMERAADLIRSFKQVAADQASESRRQFDLQHAIGEILFNLGPSFKHSKVILAQTIDEGIAMDCFPGALAQILSNLVLNGLSHGFEEGMEGVIHVSAALLVNGREVEIRVQDNGRGIAPDILGRVFDPFFTTRRNRGGTGLGLHIVYNLVRNTLGGRISVQSILGQGSTFVIRIPCTTPSSRVS
jgi:signal transduction histidine kinase